MDVCIPATAEGDCRFLGISTLQAAPHKHWRDPSRSWRDPTSRSSHNTHPFPLLPLLPHSSWTSARLTEGEDKAEVCLCPTSQERILNQSEKTPQWFSRLLKLRDTKKCSPQALFSHPRCREWNIYNILQKRAKFSVKDQNPTSILLKDIRNKHFYFLSSQYLDDGVAKFACMNTILWRQK